MGEFPYAETNLVPAAVDMFKPVLEWLEQGAPHQNVGREFDVGFNMEFFKHTDTADYEDNTCGTACCIAGAVHIFNSKFFKNCDVDLDDVGDALGMTACHQDQLFYANHADGINATPLYEINASMAAKTLRRYLTTGEVIWDKTEA